MLVSAQGNSEASTHGKLSTENGREVDGYLESGGCAKTIERISGQRGRERTQTSKVEPGGNADGHDDNVDKLE